VKNDKKSKIFDSPQPAILSADFAGECQFNKLHGKIVIL